MPKQLSLGSSGPDVVLLQGKLNARPPTVLPLLAMDGQFGSRTRARVREFQQNNGLVADGIVGPRTWGKLEDAAPPSKIAPRSGVDCGTGDPANAGGALHIQQALVSENATAKSFAPAGFAPASFVPGLPTAGLLPSLPSFRPLDGLQQAAVRPFFGLSLDFSNILISDKTGLGNRPFTIAIGVPFSGSATVVMNLGTFTPALGDLVHELTHAWQSQHAVSSASTFMNASVDCQARALVRNRLESPTPVHKDFPGNFPFSAYAFKPGKPFAEYNVEQIANQVEHNVGPIVAHVKSVAMNAADAENETSMRVRDPGEDRRDPKIVS